MAKLPSSIAATIQDCVSRFSADVDGFSSLTATLTAMIGHSRSLREHVHSVRSRVKDPDHLRDKLERKARQDISAGRTFNINSRNLYRRIFDLAGVRILHLHTEQAVKIDKELRRLFNEASFELVEGPAARTWDNEYRQLFQTHNFEVIRSPSMYTSIHYVILQNKRTHRACEIQVRTLMEEVWGEVSHTIDYPHQSEELACREQIKVLARATSTCTRLVDSIFRSHEHSKAKSKKGIAT